MPWAMQIKNSRLLKRRFSWPGSYNLGYSMLRCSGTSCVQRASGTGGSEAAQLRGDRGRLCPCLLFLNSLAAKLNLKPTAPSQSLFSNPRKLRSAVAERGAQSAAQLTELPSQGPQAVGTSATCPPLLGDSLAEMPLFPTHSVTQLPHT